MATPTDAEMVDIIRAALATGASVVSVNIDGQVTQWDRRQAMQELEFWERRAARSTGRRPAAASINLANAF